jgi:hypothetical protein
MQSWLHTCMGLVFDGDMELLAYHIYMYMYM